MGADLRVWCSQCGVPASVLVSDCTYGQSPNPRRVAAAPSRNSVTVEHRAGHDGFDEFFDHTANKGTTADEHTHIQRQGARVAPHPVGADEVRVGSPHTA